MSRMVEVLDRIRELEADLEREVAAARSGGTHSGIGQGLLSAHLFSGLRNPHVRRADYIVIDRWKLAYLNTIEKANCDYCSYATGLLAYVREVTARTEQYWCPIKHAQRIRAPHSRYKHFVDYGDAEGYKRELPVLREAVSEKKQS